MLADNAVRSQRGGLRRCEVNGSGHPARSGRLLADGEAAGSRGVPLARDYLGRIARVEAMPENASGADKTWVHKAHADAARHLRSAKRR